MENSSNKAIIKNIAKYTAYILAILLIVGFSYLAIKNISQLDKSLKDTKMKLDLKNSEVTKLRSKWDKINEELENLKKDHSSSKDKIKELEQQKQNLENQLQAKAEQKAKLAQIAEASKKASAAAPVAKSAPVAPQPVKVSGTCEQWMAQAGITDIANASFIFHKESGCNPNAVNVGSKAHGVCQALPGNKMATAGSDWYSNPVTQMRWCQSYAIGRYGSWANAVAFWKANRWW